MSPWSVFMRTLALTSAGRVTSMLPLSELKELGLLGSRRETVGHDAAADLIEGDGAVDVLDVDVAGNAGHVDEAAVDGVQVERGVFRHLDHQVAAAVEDRGVHRYRVVVLLGGEAVAGGQLVHARRLGRGGTL